MSSQYCPPISHVRDLSFFSIFVVLNWEFDHGLITDRADLLAYGFGTRQTNFPILLGDGIFTQDGAAWKHSRDMLRPIFLMNRATMFTLVKQHTEDLVNSIPISEFVDLQPLLFQLTFDTTTVLLFGRSINSLQAGTATGPASARREAGFAKAFRDAQDMLYRRERLGSAYWLISKKKFEKCCAAAHQYIDKAVQEALLAESHDNPELQANEKSLRSSVSREVTESQDDQAANVHCFLDALIKETRDPKVLRDQLINIMLAGRDTTACLLSWTLYVAVFPTTLQNELTRTADSWRNIQKSLLNSGRR